MSELPEAVEGDTANPISTRRKLIAGAAGAVAAHSLAGRLLQARAGDAAKVCAPEPEGIQTSAIAAAPHGKTFWTADSHATTITSHPLHGLGRTRSIDVGGAPLGIAISPLGGLALVTTAFYDRPGLAVVDLRTGEVDRVDVGPEPYAVAFSPDGHSAWVSGGGSEGTLTRVDPAARSAAPPVSLGAHPRGLAVLPNGKRALVALNAAAEIAVVALATGTVTRRIKTPAFPNQLAVSPGGRRAFATHNGLGAKSVSLIDLVHWRSGRQIKVGLDPAGVAFTRSGAGALVASTGNGTVTLLDARSGRRRRTFRVGGAPRAVAVGRRRGLVADGRSGRVVALPLGALR